jgi:hypothetical protein
MIGASETKVNVEQCCILERCVVYRTWVKGVSSCGSMCSSEEAKRGGLASQRSENGMGGNRRGTGKQSLSTDSEK